MFIHYPNYRCRFPNVHPGLILGRIFGLFTGLPDESPKYREPIFGRLILGDFTVCCNFCSFIHKFTNLSSDQIYQGVIDAGSTSEQEIIPEIRARYIRIRPLSWNLRICLRLELYGCDLHSASIGKVVSIYRKPCNSFQYHTNKACSLIFSSGKIFQILGFPYS